MECNVGGVEKNVRLTVGFAAVILGLTAPLGRGLRAAMISLGGIQITTALTGYCPVNRLIGRNSCRLSVPEAAGRALDQAQEFAE